MAGSMVTIPTNHLEMENPRHSHSQISPVIDQWQIQYARFINYSSSNFSRTQSSLSPLAAVQKQRLRSGAWISSSSFTACVKLVSDRSNGFSDAILFLSLRVKVLVSSKSNRVFVQVFMQQCFGFSSSSTIEVIACRKSNSTSSV